MCICKKKKSLLGQEVPELQTSNLGISIDMNKVILHQDGFGSNITITAQSRALITSGVHDEPRSGLDAW